MTARLQQRISMQCGRMQRRDGEPDLTALFARCAALVRRGQSDCPLFQRMMDPQDGVYDMSGVGLGLYGFVFIKSL